MKWISRNALISLVLMPAATTVFAQHAHVISGVEAAKTYHSKARGDVYIQVGTFANQANAKRISASIKSNTKFPAQIYHKHNYYIVSVGPLHSAAQVRQAAYAISPDTHPAPVVVETQKITPVAVEPAKPVDKSTAPAPKESTNYFNFMPKVSTIFKAPSSDPWNNSVYFNLGVGDRFYRVSGDNKVGTGDGWPPDHYGTTTINDQPYFSLMAGYTWARPDVWLPYYSLGVQMAYTSTTTISGYIDQYSLPEFRNYNFDYEVSMLNIMGTAKVDIYRWQQLMPYLTAGLGIANYATSNYSETALSGVTPRVSPGFGNGSGNNFSYSVGVGLDYILLNNLWINAEYNYTNFGMVSTESGADYANATGSNYDNQKLKNTVSSTSIFLGMTFYLG